MPTSFGIRYNGSGFHCQDCGEKAVVGLHRSDYFVKGYSAVIVPQCLCPLRAIDPSEQVRPDSLPARVHAQAESVAKDLNQFLYGDRPGDRAPEEPDYCCECGATIGGENAQSIGDAFRAIYDEMRCSDGNVYISDDDAIRFLNAMEAARRKGQ